MANTRRFPSCAGEAAVAVVAQPSVELIGFSDIPDSPPDHERVNAWHASEPGNAMHATLGRAPLAASSKPSCLRRCSSLIDGRMRTVRCEDKSIIKKRKERLSMPAERIW